VTVDRVTSGWIDRRDLVAALDGAAARKVTVISAPAGSGKTSLLRAWADRPGQPRRLAVIQVRPGQDDAQLFWLAMLDAVRDAAGTAGDAEPSAAAPDVNAAALAGWVLSELAGAPSGMTLVIDDLHELSSPEAAAQLTRLLVNLPPQVQAVLATRHDLPLRLHRLRLAGELAEIRAAELRFSERAEGWAAGLRLAVRSLAGQPDPERFVAKFSGSERTVAEYLITEMLDRQPTAVQDLLLRTCLLDRINGELADLLTGRPARNGSCWTWRTRTRSWCRWTRGGSGSATTSSCRTSCGWSCGGRCPKRCRPCTGGPPDGSRGRATWPTPSGTPRRPVTGPTRPGCSPITPSA
jgi:LuxR family maltose regulon positive regulatory protein